MFRALRQLLRRPPATGGVANFAAPDLSDLLRRPAVDLDTPELQRFIAGKVLLVSGAGGSIGSEICRQAMRFCPSRLVMVERAEPALFEIDRELRQRWVGADLAPYVADVTDATRIANIFATEQPHVVLHCAAHKHVPMMELNCGEAIKNNVWGTKVLADTALACGTQAFVLVSTDKAVNPTSVMGAAKRVAELYIQALSRENASPNPQSLSIYTAYSPAKQASAPRQIDSPTLIASPALPSAGRLHASSRRTRFAAVRFGNVLGSSGSVVPIFVKQIQAGGPVTVTHPEMRRYFMTIPEASQLVLQCGAMGQGGEVFVLDMGEPVRILDLAKELIRRSGAAEGEIEIEFTGIRPGEKLFEELACSDERTRRTAHERIRVWELAPVDLGAVNASIEELMSVADGSRQQVIEALRRAAPEYTPEGWQAPMRIVGGEGDAEPLAA